MELTVPVQLMYWPHLNLIRPGIMAADSNLPPDIAWIFWVLDGQTPAACELCMHEGPHMHPALDHFTPVTTDLGGLVWLSDTPGHPSLWGSRSPRALCARIYN